MTRHRIKVHCEESADFIQSYARFWNGEARICPFEVPEHFRFSSSKSYLLKVPRNANFQCPRGQKLVLGCETMLNQLKYVSQIQNQLIIAPWIYQHLDLTVLTINCHCTTACAAAAATAAYRVDHNFRNALFC